MSASVERARWRAYQGGRDGTKKRRGRRRGSTRGMARGLQDCPTARGGCQREGMRVGRSSSFGRVCCGDSTVLGGGIDSTALAWDETSARRCWWWC